MIAQVTDIVIASNVVKVEFQGHADDEWIAKDSAKLAPLHTKSRGFRVGLTVGSAVECLDAKQTPEAWREAKVTEVLQRPGMADLLTLQFSPPAGGTGSKDRIVKLSRDSTKLAPFEQPNSDDRGSARPLEVYETIADQVNVCPYFSTSVTPHPIATLPKGTRVAATERKGCWVSYRLRAETSGYEVGWSSIKSPTDGSIQMQLCPATPISPSAKRLVRGGQSWPLFQNTRYFVEQGGLDKLIDRLTSGGYDAKNQNSEDKSDDAKGRPQEDAKALPSAADGATGKTHTVVSPRMMQKLVSLVCVCAPMLSPPYARTILPRMYGSATVCVQRMGDPEIRDINKGMVSEVQDLLQDAFKVCFSDALAEALSLEFGLLTGLRRLKSPSLDRRINGINHISDTLDTLALTGRHWHPVEYVQYARKHDILSECLAANKMHPELARGCRNVVVTMLNQNAMRESDFDLLWEATIAALGRVDARDKIQELWKYISWRLSPEQLHSFLTRFDKVPRQTFTQWLLELMSDLLQCFNLTDATLQKGIQVIWDVAKLNPVLSRRCIKALEDIIQSNSATRAIKLYLTNFCVDQVRNHESVVLALQLLQVIVKNPSQGGLVDGDTTQTSAWTSTELLIENLERKYNIVSLLLEDLTHYRRQAVTGNTALARSVVSGEATDAKQEQEPQAGAAALPESATPGAKLSADSTRNGDEGKTEVKLADEAEFIGQVKERLIFLRFILFRSRLTLALDALQSLWKMLHNECMCPAERDLCFEWFRQAPTAGRTVDLFPVLDKKTSVLVFKNLILQDMDASRISNKGWLCFERYFVTVNMSLGNISARRGEEWVVTRLPLMGLEFLWTAVLSTDNTAQRVLRGFIRVLINAHERLAAPLASNLAPMRRSFITRCVDALSQCLKQKNTAKAYRCLKLIVQLLNISESRGWNMVRYPDSRPHRGKIRGNEVTIQAWNTDDIFSWPAQKLLSVGAHDQNTLWELRVGVGQALGIRPELVEVKFNNRVHPASHNSQTISELGWETPPGPALSRRQATFSKSSCQKNPIVIYVKRKRISPRVRLVNARNEPVPLFIKALSEIFAKFADENMHMDGAALRNYMLSCGGDQVNDAQRRRSAEDILNQYGNGRYLGKNEFIHMYTWQALDRATDHVWIDLIAQGYRYDLQLAATVYDEEQKRLAAVETLPRRILTEESFFPQLFAALEAPRDVSVLAWEVIQRLPTNPTILTQLSSLRLVQSPSPNWEPLLPAVATHETLYHLQAVKALMSPPEQKAMDNSITFHCFNRKGARVKIRPRSTSKARAAEERDALARREAAAWRKKFVLRGGYQYLGNVYLDMGRSLSKPIDSRFQKDSAFVPMLEALSDTFIEFTLDAARVCRGADDDTIQGIKLGLEEFIPKQPSTGLSVTGSAGIRRRKDSLRVKYIVDAKRGNSSSTEAKSVSHEAAGSADTVSSLIDQKLRPPVLVRQLSESFAEGLLSRVDWATVQDITTEKIFQSVAAYCSGRAAMGRADAKRRLEETESLVKTGLLQWVLCTLLDPVGVYRKLYSRLRKYPSRFFLGLLNSALSKRARALAAGAVLGACRLALENLRVKRALETAKVEPPNRFFVHWLLNQILEVDQVGKSDAATPNPKSLDKKDDERPPQLSSSSLSSSGASGKGKNFSDEQFALLSRLLGLEPGMFSAPSAAGSDGGEAIVGKLVALLRTYKSREANHRGARVPVDRMLTGILTVLTSMLRLPRLRPCKMECIKDGPKKSSFLSELFGAFLFPPESRAEDAKCATDASRRACFDLILEITRNAPENLLYLFGLLERQQRSVRALKGWDFDISQKSVSEQNLVGLKNMGATCYMNSVLQQLYMVPVFRKRILSLDATNLPKSAASADQNGTGGAKGSLLWQLQKMFGFLSHSYRQSFDMRGFCTTYRNPDGGQINFQQQCDAQEFMGRFVDLVEKELKGTPNQHLFKSTLAGTFCNHMARLDNEEIYSEKVEEFLTITLQVEGFTSLTESLDAFVSGETLRTWNPPSKKLMCLEYLPNTLVLHLNRNRFFYAHGMQQRHEKLSHRFEFPHNRILDLWHYTRQGLSRVYGGKDAKKGASTVQNLDRNRFIYRLVGVVVHKGTAERGHYYSLVQRRNGFEISSGLGADGSAWVKFDDNRVSEFDSSRIPQECFGSGKPKSEDRAAEISTASDWLDDDDAKACTTAHLLVYSRETPLSEAEIQDQVKLMERALERGGVGNGGNAETETATRQDAKSISSSPVDGKSVDDAKGLPRPDLGATGASNAVPATALLPVAIQRLVDTDNQTFLADARIFNKQYYEFFASAFVRLTPVTVRPYDETEDKAPVAAVSDPARSIAALNTGLDAKAYVRICLMALRFATTVVARSKYSSTFSVVCDHISYLVRSDPGLSDAVLEFVVRNPDILLKLALECRKCKTIQVTFLALVLRCIVVSAKADEQRVEEEADALVKGASDVALVGASPEQPLPVCIRAFQHLCGLLRSVSNHRTRMNEYFACVLGIVTEVPALRYIAIMSPYTGTKTLPQLFQVCSQRPVAGSSKERRLCLTRALPLLSCLVRSCTTQSIELKAALSPLENPGSIESKTKAPEPRRLSYRATGMCVGDIGYAFISSCWAQDAKSVCEILSHWCKDDSEVTRSTIRHILQLIAQATLPEIGKLFGVLRTLFSLQDTIIKVRIRALLGTKARGLFKMLIRFKESTGLIYEISRHLITLGNAYPELGKSIIENEDIRLWLHEWLWNFVKKDASADQQGVHDRFSDLATRHGVVLPKLESAEPEAKKWACKLCTFHNEPDSPACTICANDRFTSGDNVEAWHLETNSWREATIVGRVGVTSTFQIQWAGASGTHADPACSFPLSHVREPKGVSVMATAAVAKDAKQKPALPTIRPTLERSKSDPASTARNLTPAKPTPESGKRQRRDLESGDVETQRQHPTRRRPVTPQNATSSEGKTREIKAWEQPETKKLIWKEDEKVQWYHRTRGWIPATISMVNQDNKALIKPDMPDIQSEWVSYRCSTVKPRDAGDALSSTSVVRQLTVVSENPRPPPLVTNPVPMSTAPAQLYESELQQLEGMGFKDREKNLNALRMANGLVEAAINSLLVDPSAMST